MVSGSRGCSPNTHTTVPHRQAKVCFGYLGWRCLNCTMPGNIVWVFGRRPNHLYRCTPHASKGGFGYLGWGCLNCTMPKNIVWVRGWRPKHPYLRTPWARKGVFGIGVFASSVGVYALRNAKNCGVSAWRSKRAHTSAPNLPAKVFLDT